MEDQNQLTQNIMFESGLHVCRMSHLSKSQFGPVAFAELPRMSLLYLDITPLHNSSLTTTHMEEHCMVSSVTGIFSSIATYMTAQP